MNGRSTGNRIFIAFLKFFPLIVFAGLLIVCKLDLLVVAPIAAFTAILIYAIINKSNFTESFQPELHRFSDGRLHSVSDLYGP